MSRKIKLSAAALLIMAATAAILIATVAAQAGRSTRSAAVQDPVFQAVGPAGSSSGCVVSDLQSTAGKTIGSETLCVSSISFGPAGDAIISGSATFVLAPGTLTAVFTGHLNVISPFPTGPLALPASLVSPSNNWVASVFDFAVTGGTRHYKNATGSIRGSGFIVSDGTFTTIWTNETFVTYLAG